VLWNDLGHDAANDEECADDDGSDKYCDDADDDDNHSGDGNDVLCCSNGLVTTVKGLFKCCRS